MNNRIRIIGVPMDLGQSHRGVDMGPSAIRYEALGDRLRRLGCQVEDRGNVPVPVGDAVERGEHNYLSIIAETCQSTYQAAKKAVAEDWQPIFLGGDHSIAIGTIGGITAERDVSVLWIDAHGDCNTPETSASGNIHGMPLAVLMGQGFEELVAVGRPGAKLDAGDVALIGLRDLDAEERRMLRQSGIAAFTMRDVDEQGMAGVVRQALHRLDSKDGIHVSLDVDALDPVEAPGVGTPVRGGLTYREAHLMMEILADTRAVTSLDIVEVNPILDQGNRTAKIAVELAVSLFGKSIL